MKYFLLIISLLLINTSSFSQSSEPDTTAAGLASRIFLPSFEIGVQVPTSDLIGPSFVTKTSIEYRFRNNNDFFLRLCFDTYGASYSLPAINSTTNAIDGTVQFTDVLLAPGYRFGDETFRLLVSVMPGVKRYEFPEASIDGQRVIVRQEGRSIFTTSFLVCLEYYFDSKSALTLNVYENQVWRAVDFWEDGGAAFGFSLGFITALM